MKIVHFIFVLNIGGAENMLVDIANEQSKTCDVSVIVVKGSNDVNLISRLSKKVHFEVLSENYKKYNLLFVLKLWRFLWQFKPDVIHCHDPNCIVFLPFFLKKTTITIHNINYDLKYPKLVRQVYAISKAVKHDIDSRSPIKSVVVYNGIYFNTFKQRTLFKINTGENFRIIQVGRLLPQKGQDLLIRSLSRIISEQQLTNISVDFVGTGKEEAELKALAKELKIEKFITFLGAKDRTWIYENLSNYHALTQPSRHEGFGLTVVEAIAAKIPVISFDIDGPTEILTGLPSCYLVKPLDIEGFAAAIQTVANSFGSDTLETHCAKSYELAISKFSLEKTASNYIELYKKL